MAAKQPDQGCSVDLAEKPNAPDKPAPQNRTALPAEIATLLRSACCAKPRIGGATHVLLHPEGGGKEWAKALFTGCGKAYAY